MFILRDLLPPLQSAFSTTPLGRERAHWFGSTLLAVIVPFTSSMTSNLLRTLHDPVRAVAESTQALYLHGLADLALGSIVAAALGFDSGAPHRRALGARTR
jgi:hypothetical protein